MLTFFPGFFLFFLFLFFLVWRWFFINIPGRKLESDISHNAKIKHYPDGIQKVTCCSRPIFHESGYEFSRPSSFSEHRTYNTSNPTRSDSLKRAKESVFDIAAMNPFEYFLTLTISPRNILHVDRYDADQVKRAVQNWLRNRVQRYEGFRYLLLAENHKDGAIHAHALASGLDWCKLVDSGTVHFLGRKKPIKRDSARRLGIPLEDCRPVYNVEDWGLGHSTAIPVYGDSVNLAKYMTKYITKDMKKIFGNFYLAGGKGLVRKPPQSLADMDFDSIDERAYFVEQAGLSFKYQTIKKGDDEQ